MSVKVRASVVLKSINHKTFKFELYISFVCAGPVQEPTV